MKARGSTTVRFAGGFGVVSGVTVTGAVAEATNAGTALVAVLDFADSFPVDEIAVTAKNHVPEARPGTVAPDAGAETPID